VRHAFQGSDRSLPSGCGHLAHGEPAMGQRSAPDVHPAPWLARGGPNHPATAWERAVVLLVRPAHGTICISPGAKRDLHPD